MVADVRGEQPAPKWPDGIELRPLDVDLHGPSLYDAELEAFADEWDTSRSRTTSGSSASSAGRASTRSRAGRLGRRAGRGLLAQLPEAERRLGLHRHPRRPPGLAQARARPALLHESFRRFRETGETTVALGVDVENPTGATRLYERAGMRVLWQADVWQKELRPGA